MSYTRRRIERKRKLNPRRRTVVWREEAGLLGAARLRPGEAIEAELQDVAKANALLASSGPHTSVPPMTVFYVLPWLLSSEWPWGRPCALQIGDGPLAGTTFGTGGLDVPCGRRN